MDKNTLQFLLKLLAFSIILFGIHYYILIRFFEGELKLPLWLIYVFNAVMVFVVFAVLRHYSKDKSKDMLKFFLTLTFIKMALVIVLLLPVLFQKSDHTQLEVFNFFIPYFLYLGFEIYSLNKFLYKS